MKTYKLIVHDNNFSRKLDVQAFSLELAKEEAKHQFKELYTTSGRIVVKLRLDDLSNHINEIISTFWRASYEKEV